MWAFFAEVQFSKYNIPIANLFLLYLYGTEGQRSIPLLKGSLERLLFLAFFAPRYVNFRAKITLNAVIFLICDIIPLIIESCSLRNGFYRPFLIFYNFQVGVLLQNIRPEKLILGWKSAENNNRFPPLKLSGFGLARKLPGRSQYQ